MRAALLVLTIVAASSLVHSDTWAKFNCFETPEGKRGCACIGGDCGEMRKSDSCKSGLECDNSQLGAVICSCEGAVPWPRGTGHPAQVTAMKDRGEAEAQSRWVA